MALPDNGQISLLDIVGEFGGSGNHALTEYYRGGLFVPDTSANAGVPTSGQIAITDFYGAENAAPASYSIPAGTYNESLPGFDLAGVTITFFANGTWQASTFFGGIVATGNWVTPTSAANGTQYIRADPTLGTFSSGTTGTDLQLNTGRSWLVQVGPSSTKTCVATFTIKDGPGGSTLATGSITLTAQTT